MDTVKPLMSWRQVAVDLQLTPVSVDRLRRHFSQTYKLSDEQVEFMVRSAARSLQTTFDSVDQIPAGGDSGAVLVRVAHSLKGQLLNMGEAGWAEIARMVEFAAKAKEDHDYALPLQAIREAMSAIMEYRLL